MLPRVYDNVMKVTGGKPTADKQPFHRDLDIEVWMSEPDFRIGVDEEQVSSLEALHEDLYFVTLDFFDAMGRTLTKNRLNAPGKIFPIIHPSRAGQAGRGARSSTPATPPPRRRSTSPTRRRASRSRRIVSRDLTRIDTTAPTVVRAVVRADRVSELELQVEAKDDKEAARAVDALDGLVAAARGRPLHDGAVVRPRRSAWLSASLLKEARTRRVVAEHRRLDAVQRRVAKATPRASERRACRRAIVTWDHVIGPDESERIVAKLAALPGDPQLQGRPVVPRPRHLGDGDDAARRRAS